MSPQRLEAGLTLFAVTYILYYNVVNCCCCTILNRGTDCMSRRRCETGVDDAPRAGPDQHAVVGGISDALLRLQPEP